MHSLFLVGVDEDRAQDEAKLVAWLRDNGWEAERAGASLSDSRLEDGVSACCVVLFLISRASLGNESLPYRLELLRRLGKRVVCVLIDSLVLEEAPGWLRAAEPVIQLPLTSDAFGAPPFCADGLAALKATLAQSAVNPLAIEWPPEEQKTRSCYRGLQPLAAADAGVFFGRDNALMEALESLRSLACGHRGGVFVLTGGTGAGKSSFLCAGLLPRLSRESERFRLLTLLRPGRGGFHGAKGLAQAVAALRGDQLSSEHIAEALRGGVKTLAPLLKSLPPRPDGSPKLVVAVDHAEELVRENSIDETAQLLSLLNALAAWEDGGVIIIYSVRAVAFEALQRAVALPQFRSRVFPLPRFSRAELQAVITSPLLRLSNPHQIDSALVTAILDDAEACAEPLPLLAFALAQLMREARPDRTMCLSDYESIGRLAGCLDAAGARVLGTGAGGPPPGYETRLALLRRGLIPWLACIDAQSGAPRRRRAVAREIPVTSLPFIERLEQEGLARRVQEEGSDESAFELVHDALFAQWALLKSFLAEQPRLGVIVEDIKRAARAWDQNARSPDWSKHVGVELEKAEQLYAHPDALALLDATDRAYLVACREKKAHDKDQSTPIPTIEVESRTAERLLQRVEGTRRSARLAWAGVIASLAISGAAAWKWQALLQENKVAYARLARSESSMASTILSSSRLLRDLTQKLSTASAEHKQLLKDVASRVGDMQKRLDDEEAFTTSLRRTQSVGLNAIAQGLLANMDAPQALPAAQKSVLLMQALTSFDASNVGWRRDLSVSYETLGDAQLAVGDVDGAIASYRYDLTIAKALASSAPENSQWRWDMSMSLEKLGDARAAKGELTQALENYGEARAIREALLRADPSNNRFERGLALSYERIGSVLAQRRDVAGATASFEGALEIYQRLARADPSDVQPLLLSIVPRWRLAGLNRPKAREHLSSALETLEKLAAEGQLGEDKREWLVRVRSEIAALDQTPIPAP